MRRSTGNITRYLSKRKDVLTETVHDARLKPKVVFIKVTVKNLITSGTTVRVVSVMCRQELSAVMQTVFANLHVLK